MPYEDYFAERPYGGTQQSQLEYGRQNARNSPYAEYGQRGLTLLDEYRARAAMYRGMADDAERARREGSPYADRVGNWDIMRTIGGNMEHYAQSKNFGSMAIDSPDAVWANAQGRTPFGSVNAPPSDTAGYYHKDIAKAIGPEGYNAYVARSLPYESYMQSSYPTNAGQGAAGGGGDEGPAGGGEGEAFGPHGPQPWGAQQESAYGPHLWGVPGSGAPMDPNRPSAAGRSSWEIAGQGQRYAAGMPFTTTAEAPTSRGGPEITSRGSRGQVKDYNWEGQRFGERVEQSPYPSGMREDGGIPYTMFHQDDSGPAGKSPFASDYDEAYAPSLYEGTKRAQAGEMSPWGKSDWKMAELSPDEETAFQDWASKNAPDYNPNNPRQDYDYKAYWKAQQSGDPAAQADPGNQHFPDKFKTPYHESFSGESIYSKPGGPTWSEDEQGNVLRDSSGKVLYREGPAGESPYGPADNAAAPAKARGSIFDGMSPEAAAHNSKYMDPSGWMKDNAPNQYGFDDKGMLMDSQALDFASGKTQPDIGPAGTVTQADRAKEAKEQSYTKLTDAYGNPAVTQWQKSGLINEDDVGALQAFANAKGVSPGDIDELAKSVDKELKTFEKAGSEAAWKKIQQKEMKKRGDPFPGYVQQPMALDTLTRVRDAINNVRGSMPQQTGAGPAGDPLKSMGDMPWGVATGGGNTPVQAVTAPVQFMQNLGAGINKAGQQALGVARSMLDPNMIGGMNPEERRQLNFDRDLAYEQIKNDLGSRIEFDKLKVEGKDLSHWYPEAAAHGPIGAETSAFDDDFNSRSPRRQRSPHEELVRQYLSRAMNKRQGF